MEDHEEVHSEIRWRRVCYIFEDVSYHTTVFIVLTTIYHIIDTSPNKRILFGSV